jgi:hypothetical protein
MLRIKERRTLSPSKSYPSPKEQLASHRANDEGTASFGARFGQCPQQKKMTTHYIQLLSIQLEVRT